MRTLCLLFLAAGLLAVHAADEVSGRIYKVLPFYLDLEGQIAKSPSLYDRDAYQAFLRENTNLVSGIRYDIEWSSKNAKDAQLKVRIELRGVTASNRPKLKTLETDVKPGFFRQWAELPLTGEQYHEFGAVTAWRATIWDGDKLLGEQKSFLW
jgi:hypothetical protein